MTVDKKTSTIAACDSQVLMWSFPWAMSEDKKQKRAPQDVPDLRKRAAWLMESLLENGVDLCIPTVVIAELLAGVERHKHSRILAEFETHFFCPPFDVRASALAARLWQYERGLQGSDTGLPKEQRTERTILKADILIVATAQAAGASLFYSHEAKCRRLAKEAGMEPLDLPQSSGNIFIDAGFEPDKPAEGGKKPKRGKKPKP
jgi:predicted nucleic acid-binding protein